MKWISFLNRTYLVIETRLPELHITSSFLHQIHTALNKVGQRFSFQHIISQQGQVD